MLWEVQEFCKEHHWITDIYEFVQAWGPQKLEGMKDCPVKNYVMLMSHLNAWQARVSTMPVELLTKGKLLLLSCNDVQEELSKCHSSFSALFPSFFVVPIYPAWNVLLGPVGPCWTSQSPQVTALLFSNKGDNS